VGRSQGPHQPYYSETTAGCQCACRFFSPAISTVAAIIGTMAGRRSIHAKSVAAGVNEFTSNFERSCEVRKQILEFALGDRPMKHTEFPSISDASLTPLKPRRKPNSARGYFAYLIEALHGSRRLQAAGAFRQHRHLVHQETRKTAETKVIEAQTPRIVAGSKPDAGKPKATMSLNLKLLIVITLAGFGILHAVADGALRHAPAPQPAENGMPLPDRD
jgi:hypothetical protein